MPRLVLVHLETNRRKELPLGDGKLTVGSGEGNTIQLRRDDIAATQCSIVKTRDGRYKVVDEHTEHGTCVNGEYVAQRVLSSGDRIELGEFVLEFDPRTTRPAAEPLPAASPVAASAPEPTPGPPSEPEPATSPSPSEPEDARAGQESRRGPRRPSAAASFGRVALYVATAAVVLVVFAETVPGMLKGPQFPSTLADDRFELARVLRDGGKLDEAREVLLRLSGEVPGANVEPVMRTLQSLIEKDKNARQRLTHYRAEEGVEAKTKLGQYTDLLDQYGDVPGVSREIESELRHWQRVVRLEEQRATTPVEEIAFVSDELLRARDYSGARQRWAALGHTGLLIDAEVKAAAEEHIDRAAEVMAEGMLSRADELAERGDVLGALLVLDEDAVLAFRGTPVFSILEGRAMELEDVVREQARSGSLVGPIPPRRGTRSPSPEITDAGSAGRETDTPTRPAVPAGERLAATTAIERGDAAFHAGRMAEAVDIYQRAFDSSRASLERARLTRRIERANRARWFLDALRNHVEADPTRAASVRVRDRLGSIEGAVRGASASGLLLATDGGEVELATDQLATASAQALARKLPLSTEDHLNRAFFLLIDGTPAEFDAATMLADEEASLKTPLYSAIAFQRGMEEIPDWGYFRHDGRWLTFRERERAENLAVIEKTLRGITRAGPDDDKYTEAMAALRALVPVARDDIATLLAGRRAKMIETLRDMPELGAAERVREKRVELDKRRETALELIFDADKYFYPYRVPDCPPDKAALYPKVQQEVDYLVGEVREVWGNEFAALEDGVPLSKKFRDLRRKLEVEGEIQALCDPKKFQLEPEMEKVALLPDASKLTVRNFALDLAERKALDQSQRVLGHNATVSTSAASHEVEQIHITNMYRLMMGRGAVAINDKLCKAANKHGAWMSRTGKFSHTNDEDPKLRSPSDRIAAEGYTAGGSGENIAIAGSASGAHNGWIHSSGHHRNILYPGHRELGVGGVGRYWVQNFAGGGDYTGNLGNLDDF